jgi:hypothetical protein
MMPHELLDKKSVEGIRAIRDGQIAAESLPGEGGRWGLSVVFAPKGPLRDQLADVTTEAAKVTGEHHWRTGSEGAAHLTVRALEPHTKGPLSTKNMDRYVDAIRRSARDIDSIPFGFQGLTVSSGTLMACAEDSVGAGQKLRHRLHIELGEDGWLENSYFANGRDPIWYVTLINFTGPLLDARRFIEWFESNRDRSFAKEEFSHVDVCRWQFDGSRMTPKVVATVSLDQANG